VLLLTLLCSLLFARFERHLAALRQQNQAIEALVDQGAYIEFDTDTPRWLCLLSCEDELHTARRATLFNDEVTDADLAHLAAMPELEYLYLRAQGITDRGMPHLRGLTRLRFLGLRYNRVTDAGLAQLHDLHDLEELELLETHVTAEGVARLQRALPGLMIRW
jgi:hypothetical protein